MKFNVIATIRISFIIASIVFVIDRLLFQQGFSEPFSELVKVFSIHLLYAGVLTILNSYFFYYLENQKQWHAPSHKRIIIGVIGSITITMIALAFLRFVVFVFINGLSIQAFLNDKNATTYYIFGLLITSLVTLFFHAFYFYKSITEKKVKEQEYVAKSEKAKYESLKSQIDPHFLFNSLNVLTSLIGENPSKAEKFTTKLSKVYRYVLEQKSKDLVSLDEELDFARTYMELLKMRFENAIIFDIPEKSSNENLKIVPLSLQLLLENTIKHNAVNEKNPLHVSIKERNGLLEVSNNYIPKTSLGKGTKVGLNNIIERYSLLTLRKVEVVKNEQLFMVKLPLLSKKTQIMTSSEKNKIDNNYIKAVEQVEELKGFYSNLLSYIIVIPILIYINLKYSPQFYWFWFPMVGWGLGLLFHGFKAYGFNPILGKDWEERKIKEIMDKENKNYWN